MNLLRPLLLSASLVAVLCSCNPGTTVSNDGGSVRSSGDSVTLRVDGHPNAHVDAEGNFAIDGQQVEVTPQQRALLQEYQREFSTMTEEGLAVGKQGAAMAGKAVTAAIKGAIGGDSESIEKTMESEAKLLTQEALKLCERLIVIRGVQDRLAADLPEFKPYATIDMADLEDCKGSAEDTVKEAVQQTRTATPDAS